MSTEEEQVLLVLIYRLPVANQPEITCFIKELTAQFEELHVDEYNTIVLKGCNLDQMHDSYIDLFNNILTCFAFTLLLFYTYSFRSIRSCLPQKKRNTSRMITIAIQRSLFPSNRSMTVLLKSQY